MRVKYEKRKVLIISFVFPPLIGMGSVRIAKFAKYLPEFGWEPIVLTVHRPGDESRTSALDVSNATIVRTPYFCVEDFVFSKIGGSEPSYPGNQARVGRGASWAKKVIINILRGIRSMCDLPLVKMLFLEPIGWYPYAVKKGMEILTNYKVDVIFSSFNPSTSHLIASHLQRKTGVPWVADFRDAWPPNPYYKRPQPLQFFEEQFARRIIKRSSAVIVISEPWARQLETFYSKKTFTIPNGFDEEDYSANIPLTKKFTITYTGRVYAGKQDPTPLLEAVAELKQEDKIHRNDFEVRFFGRNVLQTISPLVRRYRLQELVKIYGFVSYEESIMNQKKSTVLLVLSWNDTRDRGTYTGKIFEYLGARRPIMALAFKGGVIDGLLKESGCGVVVNSKSEIKALLLKWLEESRKDGKLTSYFHPNTDITKKYTRKEQTRNLAEVLNRVTNTLP